MLWIMARIICTVVVVVVAQQYEYIAHRKDQVCEPSQLGLDNYSGFRIQHQIILGNWPQHHFRFSKCVYGAHTGVDTYLPIRANETGDFVVYPWGHKVCAKGSKLGSQCFWMARTRSFGFQTIPLAVPGRVIGAMYECNNHRDDSDTCWRDDDEYYNTTQPTYLLIADDAYHTYLELVNDRHFVLRIPFTMAVPPPYQVLEEMESVEWQYLTKSRRSRSRSRTSRIDILNAFDLSPVEDYIYSPEELSKRENADKKLVKHSVWNGWFKAAQVKIPNFYNGYLGTTENCKCGKVLSKFLETGARSIDEIPSPALLTPRSAEAICLNKFPDLYNELLGKLQSTPKQVRPHLMPYSKSAILRYHTKPYLRFKRLLGRVEKLYSLIK